MPVLLASETRISRAISIQLMGYLCDAFWVRFSDQPLQKHFHEELSIGFITDGANTFSYRQDVVEVPRGSICIAEPGEVHDGGLAGTEWSYFSLLLPFELVNHVQHQDLARSQAVHFPPGRIDDPSLFSAFTTLMASIFNGSAEPHLLDEEATLAFSRLLDSHAESRSTQRGSLRTCRQLAQQVKDMIRDYNCHPVTLEEISTHTGASRFAIIRAFSAQFGVTPMRYLLQIRLEQARKLLHQRVPIAEVALLTGFADQPHLTRAMKRIYGVTPGKFRSPSRHQSGAI